MKPPLNTGYDDIKIHGDKVGGGKNSYSDCKRAASLLK
jgi:hypothetical protein